MSAVDADGPVARAVPDAGDPVALPVPDADAPVVRAAGGVVVRRQPDGGRLIAVVHRPKYQDWTFPKGKLQPGESDEQTALREVREETGLGCELGLDLGSVRYRDREGRPKVVRYWVMSPDDGAFRPGDEVDELRWLTPEEVGRALSYEHDRRLLGGYLRAAGEATAYLVRHGKCGSRSNWTEDDRLRPLSKAGRRQAEALVKAFRGLDVQRAISSPYVRCVQTIRPLALDRGLPVETSEALAEGAPPERALALLEETVHTPTVLCTHGDVVPAVVLHLAERGAELDGERDWKKGSVWALERRDGRVVRARYLPPPLVERRS
ncbi:MAG TPA: NUDIX hydrolase [Actinomycetota bacterium]|nr:NUDIX hydrolase [Actinomycetota bacterium]